MAEHVRFHPLELLAAAVIVAALGLVCANVFVLGPVPPVGTAPCLVLPFVPHQFRFFGLPAC